MIHDVLLNGIADNDIRREALSLENMQQRLIAEVIGFVESRETARNANPCSGYLPCQAIVVPRCTHQRTAGLLTIQRLISHPAAFSMSTVAHSLQVPLIN